MSDRIIKTLTFVSASFILGGIAQYSYNKMFPGIGGKEKEEENLVKDYLLNQSVLYGQNKPKLWIYLDYEPNTRDWTQTQFRNSRKLNKGYINACITSIMRHCSDDFHICVIDKSAFDRFIPGFDPTKVNEKYLKEYGLIQLLYHYGGIVVPPSFACGRNLRPFYTTLLRDDCAYFGERDNRRIDSRQSQKNGGISAGVSMFFMGCPKYCTTMKKITTLMENKTTQISPDVWCEKSVQSGESKLLNGELIGTRDVAGLLITTDQLFSEIPVEWDPLLLGIAFREEDVDQLHKYDKWLRASEQDFVQSSTNIGRFLSEGVSFPSF